MTLWPVLTRLGLCQRTCTAFSVGHGLRPQAALRPGRVTIHAAESPREYTKP